MVLYQVDINYSCFSIEVKDNIVIYAPGIAKWTIGKSWDEVKKYYTNKKNAKIKKIRL
jgi:hypothetical protein